MGCFIGKNYIMFSSSVGDVIARRDSIFVLLRNHPSDVTLSATKECLKLALYMIRW